MSKADTLTSFINDCINLDPLELGKIALFHLKNESKWTDQSLMCGVWIECNIPAIIPNLLWPITRFQHVKTFALLAVKWTKLFDQLDEKVQLIQEIETKFNENPLLSSSIIFFLDLIIASGKSPADANFRKFFIALYVHVWGYKEEFLVYLSVRKIFS